MDEYFCPNCGSTLNDQTGFDPYNGTWTCTVCGKLLMDDDVYEGDTYEGVAWFCDKCGSLLNRQHGFSDIYSSWTCTECGYRNSTTEDDIIHSEDEINCPNCGSRLNDQICYSKYSDDWTCASCGKKLHRDYGDEEYTVVEEHDDRLTCPNCGSILEQQFCYSKYSDEWTCTACGKKLHRDYIDEEYNVAEEDEDRITCPKCGSILEDQFCYNRYEDDWKCTECGTQLHRDYSFESYEIVDNDEDDEDDQEEPDTPEKDSTYSTSSSHPFSSSNMSYHSRSFAKKKTAHAHEGDASIKVQGISPNKRISCKEKQKINRPFLRILFYVNAFFLVTGLRNIFVKGLLSNVRGVLIFTIFTGMFFVLSETPKKSRYIFGKKSGLSKRLFIWLCLIALYLLPDFVSTLLP